MASAAKESWRHQRRKKRRKISYQAKKMAKIIMAAGKIIKRGIMAWRGGERRRRQSVAGENGVSGGGMAAAASASAWRNGVISYGAEI